MMLTLAVMANAACSCCEQVAIAIEKLYSSSIAIAVSKNQSGGLLGSAECSDWLNGEERTGFTACLLHG